MNQQAQDNSLNQRQGEKLKAARILDNSEINTEVQFVKPAILLDLESNIELQDDYTANDIGASSQDSTLPDNKPAKKWRWFFFLAVLLASLVELTLFIRSLVTQMDWLAGVWLAVFLIVTGFLLRWLIQEYQGLKQLKKQSVIRQRSRSMADTKVIGRAELHCLEIAETLPEASQTWVKQWQKSVETHHNDSEVLALFEHKVIAKVDQLAIQQVSKNASAASVMIAVSPFALVDMLIVLWRNIHMMNQISQIYGLHLGYWARIRLIKNIFHTMLFAGAAEILSDAGNYALGTSITGKLSTRVAQGLGAGILTARIGLKAINESRPLPWLSVTKPGLSGISKQLLSDLQKQLK